MRILHECPLPPTCYVAEAALWVGLGRVPQVLVKTSDIGEDYSESDPRTNRLALDEDASILPYDAGFSEAELRHMGVEDDLAFYIRTKTLLAKRLGHLMHPTGQEAADSLRSQNAALEALGHRPRFKEPLIEAVKAGVDWAREIDAKCDAYIDLARAEVFRALTAGRLTAIGWRDEPGSISLRDSVSDLPLEAIPAAHWSLRRFNWEDSELSHSTGSYYAVQVRTAEMLAVFPMPQCQPTVQEVSLYPGCILVDDGYSSGSISVPRKRRVGRPNKGDGLSIKDVVLNYFGERVLRINEESKREALVHEAQVFAERASRQKVGRTTVQDWFRAYRASMPEIMPETDAE